MPFVLRKIAAIRVVLASLSVVAACGNQPGETTGELTDGTAEERLARAAAALQQPLVIDGESVARWSIEERMQRFAVPGVSAAVIDEGRLVAAQAWGAIEAGAHDPVTTETIFQAGSVSKPVAAVLALSLVGEGSLQLDQPVNEVLRSWKVPDNQFTRAVPVTLYHLLTHQAGLTRFGYLIRRGEADVPSMAELLKGGIHDWPAVTVESLPGSRYAYSNSGYCVLQLLLEDRSGKSLHELARQRIFEPLGMKHSTFDEPLEPTVLANAASGHERKRLENNPEQVAVPVEGKAEIAPGAAGGLWSTPSDLAKLAAELIHSFRGDSDRLLTTELARQFLTRQVDDVGLGIFLLGEGSTLRAQHAGGMVGFVCNLVFYPNMGRGAVVMANSDGGRWVQQELIAAIAEEFDWPGYPVRHSRGTATLEQLRELVGVYTFDPAPSTTFTVRIDENRAIGQINQYPPFELTPTTEPDLFVLARESLEILFHRGDDGSIESVVLRRAGDSGQPYTRRSER